MDVLISGLGENLSEIIMILHSCDDLSAPWCPPRYLPMNPQKVLILRANPKSLLDHIADVILRAHSEELFV
jgi:hypothetical protein